MEKIVMLGTGHGTVMDYYNSCFLLVNGNKNLLVDTGGSVRIIKNLEDKGYKLSDIHDIFISHCHTDHILGLCWMIKKIVVLFTKGEYHEKINIYCNSEVAESINKLVEAVFPEMLQRVLNNFILIHVLYDGEVLNIAGEKITFFDTLAKGNLLYGFETVLNNGAKLVFLGDEICNPMLYDKLKDADYVMHEAFCLDSEVGIPKIIKEVHSTVKFVCQTLEPFNIRNLILYHTEDSHKNKKELYMNEAREYFSGNVIVPDDLDEIILEKE